MSFCTCLCRSLWIGLLLCANVVAEPAVGAVRGELVPGRYIGWIKTANSEQKLAVVGDFFVESPEDLTEFPKLVALIKVSLGGYSTHEYLVEAYKNLKYDYDLGQLTFDENPNDLSMVTRVVKEGGRNKIVGDIFIKSSAMSGSVELTEESDEPEDFVPASFASNESFIPLLEGQYSGVCNQKEAVLQIQTTRRSEQADSGLGSSLTLEKAYQITGRLGFKGDALCGKLGRTEWCARAHFDSGSYNMFQRKLLLKGQVSANLCSFNGDGLVCEIQAFERPQKCVFKKSNDPIKKIGFFNRRFNLSPTSEQMRNLPSPEPPANEDLANALRGEFSGYIHNETNDTYIALGLQVIPSSSTDNPHNPNQMVVSVTSSLKFGNAYVIQRFDPRSFYLRPGFSLSGQVSDGFLVINDWREGYIRGVWYSHKFARVGTVQLVKGALPTAPSAVRVVSSFEGEYESSKNMITHWLQLLFPARPSSTSDHLIELTGAHQMVKGNTPIRKIEQGWFDPYTGRIGWNIGEEERPNMVTGQWREADSLWAFWPSSTLVGAIFNDFSMNQFVRLKEKDGR